MLLLSGSCWQQRLVGAGLVPRSAAARRGREASAHRRRLPRERDDEERGETSGAQRVLGRTQTLHRADHRGGEDHHGHDGLTLNKIIKL